MLGSVYTERHHYTERANTMQTTKPVASLTAGDFIVSIGKRPIGATFESSAPLKNGAHAVGPQGGKYTMVNDMIGLGSDLETHVALTMRTGPNPIVETTAFARIEVMEEF